VVEICLEAAQGDAPAAAAGLLVSVVSLQVSLSADFFGNLNVGSSLIEQ
jgi:hypothetical protein